MSSNQSLVEPVTPDGSGVERLRRNTLVLECATRLGTTWAQALCDATRRERRVVAGGFPGTIPEARQRVVHYFHGELARLRLSPLEPAEVSRAVEVAYACARKDWLNVGRETKYAPNLNRRATKA